MLKFLYSEKATKFCEIFPLLLSVCTEDKSKGKISQNFVAFSEYTNFRCVSKLKYNDMMDYMEKPINHYLIIVVRLVNYLGYLVESLYFNRQNSRNVGNSLGVLSTGQLGLLDNTFSIFSLLISA